MGIWLLKYVCFSLIAPTAVRNLNYTLGQSSVLITWDEPAMPNGIITYTISIIGEDLIDGTIVMNSSTTVNSTELFVEAIQPYSTYTVVVTSRTGAGDGDPVNVSFQTPEAGKWSCSLSVQYFLMVARIIYQILALHV